MRQYRRVDKTRPASGMPHAARSVSRLWTDRRTLPRAWLLVSVLVGLVLAEATVWGWFTLRPELGPSVMTDENCSRKGCHQRAADDAAIYVAVDGKEILPNQPVSVTAGDLFEVDFHFTGMVGDPDRFSRVGMEIVVPDDPPWRVAAGTLAHPEEWSSSGIGGSLWSPAWDRAANGDGPTVAEWVQSPDRANAYYLSWAAAVAAAPVGQEFILSNTVADQGTDGNGDPDGIAGHAGADALIAVPLDAEPGLFHVEVSGVGHTLGRKRARVSATIAISVTRPLATGPSVTTRPVSGVEVYQENCTGCHGATPNAGLLQSLPADEAAIAQAIREGNDTMPPYASSAGGPLSEEEIQAAVQYLLNQAELAEVPGARPIPHDVAAASDCLACHSGERKPPSHETYDAEQCLSCHTQGPEWMKGPPIVHSLEKHQDCLRCHVAGAPIGVPATHAGRTNQDCLICHVPGPEIPPIPHPLPPEPICLFCHGPEGKAPLPPSHEGRGEDVCLTACHSPGGDSQSEP